MDCKDELTLGTGLVASTAGTYAVGSAVSTVVSTSVLGTTLATSVVGDGIQLGLALGSLLSPIAPVVLLSGAALLIHGIYKASKGS